MNSAAPQETALPFAHTLSELTAEVIAHERLSNTQVQNFQSADVLNNLRWLASTPRLSLRKLISENGSGFFMFVALVSTSSNPSSPNNLQASLKHLGFSEEDIRFGIALGAQEQITRATMQRVDHELRGKEFGSSFRPEIPAATISFYQVLQRRVTERATPTPQRMRR